MKLFKTIKSKPRVEFCEHCSSVCDAACPAEVARERTRELALAARIGL